MSNPKKIASQLQIELHQVTAAIELLDADNTIPFIARYRKEVTGILDEEQLRDISTLLGKLRTLDSRRKTILNSIKEQGKLNERIMSQIEAAETRTTLEDIYQPFKPRRKTRASTAKENGLQPLADLILQQSIDLVISQTIDDLTIPFLTDRISSPEDAWEGARDIVAETISDHPDVRRITREKAKKYSTLKSEKIKKAEDPRGIYQSYYAFEYSINKLHPHQILAINRGENEKLLRVKVNVPERDWRFAINSIFPQNHRSPLAEQLNLSAEEAANRLLIPAIERDIRRTLTERAEGHAIQVFATNLRSLLLQPPLAGHIVMGIDPGYRTGCKAAVVDPTGKPLDTATIYPHTSKLLNDKARQILNNLITKHNVTLIAIGNGTASRETESLIAELIQEFNKQIEESKQSDTHKTPGVQFIIVSEAGASVYSASQLARNELPKMDVSMRGAVSIARRVQDPMAELVKIDARSIGVGMYQHDIDQKKLGHALDDVVESVVNMTGVDLNSASVALLTYVSGVGPSLGARIVKYRDQNGPYPNRETLQTVPGLGPKAFEQSAGFLRIRDGDNPLDDTAIHPDSYSATEKLLQRAGLSKDSSIGNRGKSLKELLSHNSMEILGGELGIGLPTLEDIFEQLLRPGRDPREDLSPPILRSDILKIEDLTVGTCLKGTVRNVVDFGAFVDIGVKQDGLLHRSQIPHGSKLALGDIIDVEVLNIEIERGRISLGTPGPSEEKI
jgi:uncharacterized protein